MCLPCHTMRCLAQPGIAARRAALPLLAGVERLPGFGGLRFPRPSVKLSVPADRVATPGTAIQHTLATHAGLTPVVVEVSALHRMERPR